MRDPVTPAGDTRAPRRAAATRAPAPTRPPRRTQPERRAATRQRLLDAALECLVERGYAGTTVTDVQVRAGVARGTLLHHFPTKDELLAAAVLHVAERRLARWADHASTIGPGADRVDALVETAWRDLTSPAFFAGLELWVAARTDPELREVLVPVETDLFDRMKFQLMMLLGRPDDLSRAATLAQFTVDLLTGMALSTILSGQDGERDLLLRRWKRALRVLLGELDAAALHESNRPNGRWP